MIDFMKEHWMLLIAAVAACVSMFFVLPDEAYLGYFDWQTIGCLFCVLAVANAFRSIGVFDRISCCVVMNCKSLRILALGIVLATGALSMAFTNDIALIITLPLAATIMIEVGCVRILPIVVSMQALSANLCGMITPFGNPQNLYLFTRYELGLGEFLSAMAFPFFLSLALIVVVTLLLIDTDVRRRTLATSTKKGALQIHRERDPEGIAFLGCDSKAAVRKSDTNLHRERDPEGIAFLGHKAKDLASTVSPECVLQNNVRISIYVALFFAAMLAVFRVIPFWVAVIVVVVAFVLLDRRALREVDYALLATFLCFFVFAGNLSRIPALESFLGSLMNQWGLFVSALTSQVISNVPAAVILSHFTEDWAPLLIGVNIGGSGTFVGSLASLIAIRFYSQARKTFPKMKTSDAPTSAQFLIRFGALNIAFFIVLLGTCLLYSAF